MAPVFGIDIPIRNVPDIVPLVKTSGVVKFFIDVDEKIIESNDSMIGYPLIDKLAVSSKPKKGPNFSI